MSKDLPHSVFNSTVRAFVTEAIARPVAKWGGIAAIFLSVSGDTNVTTSPVSAVDAEGDAPVEQEIRIYPRSDDNAWVEYRA